MTIRGGNPAVVLADYQRPIRLDAVLVVVESLTAEAAWLSHALTHAVPIRVATTSEDLLRTDPGGPIGPIWATARSIAGTGTPRVRLGAG